MKMAQRYTLQEVCDQPSEREFLDLVDRIYAAYPLYVRPLDESLKGVFNPQKNRLFNGGEAIRWIVRNAEGVVVGRIAAFYNREQAALEEQPTGGCGFFESTELVGVALE